MHADTSVLSFVPQKRLALSARVVPSGPRPQPPYAKPLPVQVEEGLAVSIVVVDSGLPPPPVAAAVAEGADDHGDDRPQAASELPAETGPGSGDMVMVPADADSAPTPPAEDHDVATSTAPESSPAASAASVEGAVDLSSSRYVDFPGIGTIDLDAAELPSNDREMLEVATEKMFAYPSILDTITSVPLALRQDEGAGGSAPPAAPEPAEGVLGESAAGMESVVVVSPPSPTREGTDAYLPRAAGAVVAAPVVSVVDTVEGVVRGAGPSSPRPVATAAEEVLVPSLPIAAPQECDAPEGATRAASPEILEAEGSSDAALSQGVGNGEAQVLELACPHGRLPSRLVTMLRTTRRPRRVTPSSAG
jgi:hypothetical protein